MRCNNWPDSHCHSPVACEGFGYCRERHWDFKGERVDVELFKEAWKKLDNDGKPASFPYGV